MNDQPNLRDALRLIADQAAPVDMYDRSLARSRRISRTRAQIAAAAAVAGLALAGGTAVSLVDRDTPVPPPPVAATTAWPVPGVPGSLYYVTDADRVVRLAASGPVAVLPSGGSTAVVSPDGRSIAHVTQHEDEDTGEVVVTDRDGSNPRTVLRDALADGREPSWSPDSSRLLVERGPAGASVLGVVRVATGAFTRLAHPLDGIHFLWSADGRRLGYSTGECRLVIADADGGNPVPVPVIGVDDRKTNPSAKRSCDPYSLSVDGSRMAVRLNTGDEPDGDVTRDLTANAVIDTRTGAVLSLPVKGTVNAVLFGPDDSMLIRSADRGEYQLTLVSAGGTITAQVPEPAAVKRFSLLARTTW